MWIIFSLSFLSKHQRQVGLCGSRLHVSPRPSIAMTCCLSDKHSRCWHYQMLSACRPPRAFALLWPLDEVSGPATWLWGTVCVYVCVCEQAWTCMCMLQIDLPLVCHIKPALCWPPSCLQAVRYIPQLSPATLRTQFVPRQEKSIIITAVSTFVSTVKEWYSLKKCQTNVTWLYFNAARVLESSVLQHKWEKTLQLLRF